MENDSRTSKRIRHLSLIRNWILFAVAIAVVILIAVRIRSIVNVSLRSEAAETRLQLEAMADQDVAPIQEEIDLKRSVVEAENEEEENSDTN